MIVAAPAMRPWVEGVEQLTDAEGVLDLARVLDRLIPSRAGGRGAKGGEPDGVDGFGRRGPLERLVPSAWAMAKLAPEEFLRRFAHGELLYRELRRRQPGGGGRVVLAFDVGPEQLGAPRLAQLALWVAVARRARREGDELVPGLLQHPQQVLPEGLTRGGVRRWSDGRARTGVLPEEALRLVQRVGPWRPADRLWWVSPAPVPDPVLALVTGAGGGVIRVSLTEEDLDAGSSVRVRLRREGQHAEVVFPPLPPDRAARILRDPLRRRDAPRRVGDPTIEQLLWAPSGRRLLARSRGGAWGAVAVPEKDTHRQLRVAGASLPPAPVVAVGWGRGRAIAVGYQDDRWVWGAARQAVPGPAPPPGVGTVVANRGAVGTWLCVGGELFRLGPGRRVEAEGPGRLMAHKGGVRLLRQDGPRWIHVVLDSGGRERTLERIEAPRAYLVHALRAYGEDGGRLFGHGWTFELPDDQTFVGMVQRRDRVQVVCLSHDRHLVVHGRGPAPVVLGAVRSQPVVGTHGCVAWLQGEELVVHDLGLGALPPRVGPPRILAPGKLW